MRPLIVALLLLGARTVAADSGSYLGESARAAALASSVTARSGDGASTFFNPGALGDVERSTVALLAHGGGLDLEFQRDGDPPEDLGRGFSGLGVTTVLRAPGVLDFLRVGLAFHLPAQNVLQLRAPARDDVPTTALYGSRVGRIAITASAGVAVFERIQVGYGFTLAPKLTLPTTVRFDPTRGDTVDEGITVVMDRRLPPRIAWLFGARFEVHERVSLGVAYRQAIRLSATGSVDIQAGSLRLDDPLDFVDFNAPEQLALGAAVSPLHSLSVSLDVLWSRWSAYRTIFNRRPDPGFRDTWSLRVGVESEVRPGWSVRGGYAFEPTPLREQVAGTNLLDAHRHVLALGVGADLAVLASAAVRFDLYARTHLLHEQRATKDPERLSDADPRTPDVQIDDLGYPGFRAKTRVYQVGLTLSVPIGGGS